MNHFLEKTDIKLPDGSLQKVSHLYSQKGRPKMEGPQDGFQADRPL